MPIPLPCALDVVCPCSTWATKHQQARRALHLAFAPGVEGRERLTIIVVAQRHDAVRNEFTFAVVPPANHYLSACREWSDQDVPGLMGTAGWSSVAQAGAHVGVLIGIVI